METEVKDEVCSTHERNQKYNILDGELWTLRYRWEDYIKNRSLSNVRPTNFQTFEETGRFS